LTTNAIAHSEPAVQRRELTPWDRLYRIAPARFSLFFLAAVLLVAIIGPLLLPASYREVSTNQFAPPSWSHPFGTDLNGRDVLFRVLEGARVSLLVGAAGAAISFLVGTAYGLVSGYVGGKWDAFMMRAVEVLYSIPRLIIILILINTFDLHFKNWLNQIGMASMVGYSKIIIMIFSLGLIEWLTMARIVRGQVLSLKSQQFIAAARSLGQTHRKIILRHLLPNLAGIVIIYLTLTIPAVILDESFLSFLGLGIQAPQASWGSLLSDGALVINPIRSNWWLLVFPALAMSSTLLALNFLGDGLRDALDPRKH
jgi:peptide/nickel transport system permease protein/oligopeptide transport system permease protein